MSLSSHLHCPIKKSVCNIPISASLNVKLKTCLRLDTSQYLLQDYMGVFLESLSHGYQTVYHVAPESQQWYFERVFYYFGCQRLRRYGDDSLKVGFLIVGPQPGDSRYMAYTYDAYDTERFILRQYLAWRKNKMLYFWYGKLWSNALPSRFFGFNFACAAAWREFVK